MDLVTYGPVATTCGFLSRWNHTGSYLWLSSSQQPAVDAMRQVVGQPVIALGQGGLEAVNMLVVEHIKHGKDLLMLQVPLDAVLLGCLNQLIDDCHSWSFLVLH